MSHDYGTCANCACLPWRCHTTFQRILFIRNQKHTFSATAATELSAKSLGKCGEREASKTFTGSQPLLHFRGRVERFGTVSIHLPSRQMTLIPSHIPRRLNSAITGDKESTCPPSAGKLMRQHVISPHTYTYSAHRSDASTSHLVIRFSANRASGI